MSKAVLIYFLQGGKNAFTYSGELRADNDLTQRAVARILRIDQATYSRYETGILDIPNLTLVKLAKFYKTSTDYLLRLTDEKNPYKN